MFYLIGCGYRTETGEIASSKEVQVIKDSQQDEEVDILNDSSCASDSESDDMEDVEPSSPVPDRTNRFVDSIHLRLVISYNNN